MKWDFTSTDDAVVIEAVANYGSDSPNPVKLIARFPAKYFSLDLCELIAENICNAHNSDRS